MLPSEFAIGSEIFSSFDMKVPIEGDIGEFAFQDVKRILLIKFCSLYPFYSFYYSTEAIKCPSNGNKKNLKVKTLKTKSPREIQLS